MPSEKVHIPVQGVPGHEGGAVASWPLAQPGEHHLLHVAAGARRGGHHQPVGARPPPGAQYGAVQYKTIQYNVCAGAPRPRVPRAGPQQPPADRRGHGAAARPARPRQAAQAPQPNQRDRLPALHLQVVHVPRVQCSHVSRDTIAQYSGRAGCFWPRRSPTALQTATCAGRYTENTEL